MKIRTTILISLLGVLLYITLARALNIHGFHLENALVPESEILSGGPPKDGIPAIDKPVFIKASQAKSYRDTERIIGITHNGISKAYPIRIMNWHEIVNDSFNGEAITVTYCPLCGSGMAIKAQLAGKTLHFGVSGLLYNSDVLLFDRETESLWSQILSKAISGPMKGNFLTDIPIDHTSWADWKKQHPDSLLLSEDTGFKREYRDNPYAGYDSNKEIIFPVKFRAKGYHPKEQVFGIKINGVAKAYPFVELAKGPNEIKDIVNGKDIIIHFNIEHKAVRAFDAEGKQIAGVTLFWFAWYAFNPHTAIYRYIQALE